MAHTLAHMSSNGNTYTLVFSDVVPAAEARAQGVVTMDDVVHVVMTRTNGRPLVVSDTWYPVALARRVWAATARAADWYRVV